MALVSQARFQTKERVNCSQTRPGDLLRGSDEYVGFYIGPYKGTHSNTLNPEAPTFTPLASFHMCALAASTLTPILAQPSSCCTKAGIWSPAQSPIATASTASPGTTEDDVVDQSLPLVSSPKTNVEASVPQSQLSTAPPSTVHKEGISAARSPEASESSAKSSVKSDLSSPRTSPELSSFETSDEAYHFRNTNSRRDQILAAKTQKVLVHEVLIRIDGQVPRQVWESHGARAQRIRQPLIDDELLSGDDLRVRFFLELDHGSLADVTYMNRSGTRHYPRQSSGRIIIGERKFYETRSEPFLMPQPENAINLRFIHVRHSGDTSDNADDHQPFADPFAPQLPPRTTQPRNHGRRSANAERGQSRGFCFDFPPQPKFVEVPTEPRAGSSRLHRPDDYWRKVEIVEIGSGAPEVEKDLAHPQRRHRGAWSPESWHKDRSDFSDDASYRNNLELWYGVEVHVIASKAEKVVNKEEPEQPNSSGMIIQITPPTPRRGMTLEYFRPNSRPLNRVDGGVYQSRRSRQDPNHLLVPRAGRKPTGKTTIPHTSTATSPTSCYSVTKLGVESTDNNEAILATDIDGIRTPESRSFAATMAMASDRGSRPNVPQRLSSRATATRQTKPAQTLSQAHAHRAPPIPRPLNWYTPEQPAHLVDGERESLDNVREEAIKIKAHMQANKAAPKHAEDEPEYLLKDAAGRTFPVPLFSQDEDSRCYRPRTVDGWLLPPFRLPEAEDSNLQKETKQKRNPTVGPAEQVAVERRAHQRNSSTLNNAEAHFQPQLPIQPRATPTFTPIFTQVEIPTAPTRKEDVLPVPICSANDAVSLSSSLEAYTLEHYVYLKAKRAVVKAGQCVKREINTIKTEVQYEVKTRKNEIKQDIKRTKHAAKNEVKAFKNNLKNDIKRMTEPFRNHTRNFFNGTNGEKSEFSIVPDDPEDFADESNNYTSEESPADAAGQPSPFECTAAARSRVTKIKHTLAKTKELAKDSIPRSVKKVVRTAKGVHSGCIANLLPLV